MPAVIGSLAAVPHALTLRAMLAAAIACHLMREKLARREPTLH
jgi:hypothetical protein